MLSYIHRCSLIAIIFVSNHCTIHLLSNHIYIRFIILFFAKYHYISNKMARRLSLLLLELQLLGSNTAWPVLRSEYQIGFDNAEVFSSQQRLSPEQLQSSTESPSQDAQEQANHPVIIRVDYSNIHRYDEADTQSSWLSFIAGKQYLSTPSLLYQQVWVCGEETGNVKCRLKFITPYELPLEPYLTSVVACRAIAVLIFSTSLMVSIVAMLWSRYEAHISPVRPSTDDFVVFHLEIRSQSRMIRSSKRSHTELSIPSKKSRPFKTKIQEALCNLESWCLFVDLGINSSENQELLTRQ